MRLSRCDMANKQYLLVFFACMFLLMVSQAAASTLTTISVTAKGRDVSVAEKKAGQVAVTSVMRSMFSTEMLKSKRSEIINLVVRPYAKFVKKTTVTKSEQVGNLWQVSADVDVDIKAMQEVLKQDASLAKAMKTESVSVPTTKIAEAKVPKATTPAENQAASSTKVAEVKESKPNVFTESQASLTSQGAKNEEKVQVSNAEQNPTPTAQKAKNVMSDADFIALIDARAKYKSNKATFNERHKEYKAFDAKVLSAIKAGANPNAKASNGEPALLHYLRNVKTSTDWNMVPAFIQAGCDLNWNDGKGNSLMRYVIANAHIQEIMPILAQKPILDYSIDNKKYAIFEVPVLIHGSERSNAEVLNALLVLGAKPNYTLEANKTILFDCVKQKDSWLLERVLKSNDIDINVKNAKGNNLLHEAIKIGNGSNIATLINTKKHKVDINALDNDGNTPIILLAKSRKSSGSKQMITLLLEHGADTKITNKKGESVLEYAKRNNYSELLSTLLLADKSGKSSKEKEALLLKAIDDNDIDLVTALLKSGVNVNVDHGYGGSALALAASENNHIVKQLLAFKADPNLVLKYDETAIFSAHNIEVLQTLLDAGADIKHKSKYGISLFTPACLNENFSNSDLIKLSKKGFSFNEQDKEGNSILYQAVSDNNLALTKFLLEQGVDVNTLNDDGESPLFRAVRKDLPLVQVLVNAGADTSIKTEDGKSIMDYVDKYAKRKPEIKEYLAKVIANPEQVVAKKDQSKPSKMSDADFYALVINEDSTSKEIIDALNAGANPNAKGGKKEKAVLLAYIEEKDHASHAIDIEVISAFLKAKANINIVIRDKPLALFALNLYRPYENDLAVFKLLASQKPVFNDKDWSAIASFIDAGSKGKYDIYYADILEIMLQNGANPNAMDGRYPVILNFFDPSFELPKSLAVMLKYGVNINGEMPLLSAAISRKSYKSLAMLLSDKKTDLNVVMDLGRGGKVTPLTHAMKNKDDKAIQMLLDAGVDVNIADGQGTPLMHAIGEEQNDLIDKLIAYKGIDVNKNTKDGLNALALALITKNKAVFDKLIKAKADINNTMPILSVFGKEALQEGIKLGGDVKSSNANGQNALMLTCSDRRIPEAYLKEILAYGFDINAIDNEGLTALYYAVKGNNNMAVRFLLKNGANMNIKTKNGDTLISFVNKYAARNEMLKIMILDAKGSK